MSFNPAWLDKELMHIKSDIGQICAVSKQTKADGSTDERLWVGKIETWLIDSGSMKIMTKFDTRELKNEVFDVADFKIFDTDGLEILTHTRSNPIHKIAGQGLYFVAVIRILEGVPTITETEGGGS